MILYYQTEQKLKCVLVRSNQNEIHFILQTSQPSSYLFLRKLPRITSQAKINLTDYIINPSISTETQNLC